MSILNERVAIAVKNLARKLFEIGEIGFPSNSVTHVDVWFIKDGNMNKITFFAKDLNALSGLTENR